MLDKNGVEIRVGDMLEMSNYLEHWIVIRPDGEGFLLQKVDSSKTGGAFYSDGWEVIRRADGSDPRTGPEAAERFLEDYDKLLAKTPEMLAGFKSKGDGGHFWDLDVQICQDCGMRMELFEDTKASCTGKPVGDIDQKWWLAATPKEPFRWQKRESVKSPAELYADFRRIVTETVAREAPKVKVVTDFGTRFHDDGVGMMWLSLGNLTELGYSTLRGNEPSYVADVLYLLDELRRKSDPLR